MVQSWWEEGTHKESVEELLKDFMAKYKCKLETAIGICELVLRSEQTQALKGISDSLKDFDHQICRGIAEALKEETLAVSITNSVSLSTDELHVKMIDPD